MIYLNKNYKNKSMKKLMLLWLMLSIGVWVSAQTITGTVTSAKDGSTLPGVSVTVKGTNTGTVTDVDGNFSIPIRSEKAVLVFTYIGFKTKDVPVTGTSRALNVALNEDVQLLGEVVVSVGYGTMKRSDISGASISMGEDKIKGSVITNLDQAFQGRVAGVTSVLTSGAPGSSTSIRVRGISTINANAEPLYVIDGVIVQSQKDGIGTGGAFSTVSPIANINPSDILTMEILKDASATAIYGSQGANGVVLITTKRGKAGEAKFSYDGYVGMNVQGKRLDMMNLREYAEFASSVSQEYSVKYGGISGDYYADPSLLGAGTNWQDAIFQRALIQNHQLAAQGGTESVRYYVSGNYMGQEGTIIGSTFNRYTFRMNLDANLKKWLKLGVNASYNNTKEHFTLANGDEGMLRYSLNTPPSMAIYDMDGNYSSTMTEGYFWPNPIGLAMLNDNNLLRTKLNGSIFLDVSPIKNLVWHSEVGFDFGASKRNEFQPTYDFGNVAKTVNELRERRDNNTYYQIINNLTYTGKYQLHHYTIMLGQDLWESSYNYLEAYATGLPSNDIQNLHLADKQFQSIPGNGFGSSAMASFFARATYNYDERYMGTFTFRRDGSSNFGPLNRWANFVSTALSWRFSNEAFLKDQTVLSNGKLRVGWGQTGNQGIGGYKWGAAISQMPSGVGMGYRQANIANPYIHWETQKQWNVGLDLGFIDRINVTIDAYDKTSADMLTQLDLPSYMGTKGNGSSALAAPWGNFGTINNKGLEISLNTQNLKGAFEWNTDLQLTFVKNKLVSLAPGTPPLMGYQQWDGNGSPITLTKPGQPLYEFYGFKTDGYYKDRADIDGSPKPAAYPKDGSTFNLYNTVWVGDIKFKDVSGPDGKPDGIIDDYDRTDLGSPLPKVQFGLNNTFLYKNFDLSVFINGTYGNKVFNANAIGLTAMRGSYNNQLRDVVNRARIEVIDPNKTYDGTNGVWNWFQDIDNVRLANTNPSQPRALHAGDPNDNTRFSDRYLEDGSYVRLKNIVFGYTVPTAWTRRFQVENVRVYANIQNLLTLTHYTGFDPEVGVSTMSGNVFGMDNGRYPSPQSYTFGLNISF